MVERFERFSFAVSEISRYWHKLSADEMGKYGLRSTHSVYLLTMLKYPEGLTAMQICELCGKDKSDVSRMMSILEKKDFVKKEGIYHNLYGGVFKLTDAGIAAAEQVRSKAALAVELAGKDINNEERTVFYKALESIASNLRELSKNGFSEK